MKKRSEIDSNYIPKSRRCIFFFGTVEDVIHGYRVFIIRGVSHTPKEGIKTNP